MKRLLAVTAVALTAIQVAGAAEVDRVQVGQPGRNTTRGFSPQTHVVVTSPDGYVRTAFDGDSGDWRGPVCVVASNPSLSTNTTIPWAVTFSNRYRSAEEAADAARTFDDLSVVERTPVPISHRIRGREVGQIRGFYVLAATQAAYAWHEIGLGVPLTRGVVAAIRFWSRGPSFACAVDGRGAAEWHQRQALAAARAVVVDGNLPVARVTATGGRFRITGRVSDGFGHAVVGVRVTIQRRTRNGWQTVRRATTDAGGNFRAAVTPGIWRASVGPARSASARVR